MSSISAASDHTTVRPFAPDDFRREKKAIPHPHAASSRRGPLRPHPVPESLFRSSGQQTASGVMTPPRRSSPLEGSSNTRNGHEQTVHSSSQASMKNFQEEAEQDWQYLQQRRRSLCLLPSHLQQSLTKSALMTRSESAQTLCQQSLDNQRAAIQRDRGVQMDRSISLPYTALNSSDHASLASSYSSSRDQRYGVAQPASDSLPRQAKKGGSSAIQTRVFHRSNDSVHRASSKLSGSSCGISSAGDSAKELLQDICDEETMPLVPQNQSDCNTTASRSLLVRGLPSNSMPSTPLRRLETNNILTTDAKMEQLKRSQKLDTMLGEEWRRKAEDNRDHAAEVDSDSSSSSLGPFKSVMAKRISLMRRQSDPLHLHLAHQAGMQEKPLFKDLPSAAVGMESERANKEAAPIRWKSLHLKRSRSSLGLRHDQLSSLHSSPLSPTAPPLDIHPKAATLLGLCVLPEPLQKTQALTSSRTQARRLHMHERPISCSSLEMLKDPDSLICSYGLSRGPTQQPRLDEQPNDIRSVASDSIDTDDNSKFTHRTERRRRVKKISRWLGAVVPPHLVLPNPESGPFQQRSSSASGYNLDDAPPSPFADYMSGTPLQSGSVEGEQGATGPLFKARAAMHAKMIKKATTTAPSTNLLVDHQRSALNEQDRVSNVKRNHKLTSMFGQAPPQDLLLGTAPLAAANSRKSAERPRSKPAERRSASWSPKNRERQFRSVSPSTHEQAPLFLPIESSDIEDASSDSAKIHQITRQQYRASIESLEYLVAKNPPLLKELVTAFEQEEAEAKRRGRDKRVKERGSRLSHNGDATITTSIDSSQIDLSLDEVQDVSRAREVKIRRHHKLGRWFGESLPSSTGQPVNDENIPPRLDASHPTPYSANSTQRYSTRMAPRSAGSAQRPHSLHHRKALSKILNSLEGEVTDDDALSDGEKQQLQQRLWRLKSVDAMD